MNRLDELLIAAMDYDEQDTRRIQHFVKVHEFARLIGIMEQLDERTQTTLEAAAIVHDIGIHEAEKKYGDGHGKNQEIEGPPVARKIMEDLGWEAEIIDRVCYLVGHHHTYSNIDGTDYQILVEADFLVNLFEGHKPVDAVKNAYRKIFRTEGGKRLFHLMFAMED